MTEIHDTNGQFVSKNWIIMVLIGLVCFFGGIGIRDTLAKTRELEARITTAESQILVIRTQYEYIVKTLDEIKKEVKK